MAVSRLDIRLQRDRALRKPASTPTTSSAKSTNTARTPRSTPAQPKRHRRWVSTATNEACKPTPVVQSEAEVKPEHLAATLWKPGRNYSGKLVGWTVRGGGSSKEPARVKDARADFMVMMHRVIDARQLVAAYPSIHPSFYAPITSNSKAIPTRDRLFHAPPRRGTKTWTPNHSYQLPPEVRQKRAIVTSVGLGLGKLKTIGYALKCFHLWCCVHDVPDELRLPVQPDILEGYLACLVGHFSRKTIVARVAGLQAWHHHYRVEWLIKDAHIEQVLSAASVLTPYPKLKREPFLLDHLTRIIPFLNFSDPFDVAWWAATTFAHRAILRSGEFTIPSQTSYNSSRHLSLKHISIVKSNGKTVGLTAHLPWDKVNGPRGADVSITPLAAGHPACPVAALLQHFSTNGTRPNEPLFSFTSTKGPPHGRRLGMTKQAWRNRLDELVKLASLPPMAGHSVRIGGATQLLLDGVDPLVVKVLGRWKSDAFEVYWRNVTAVMANATSTKKSASAPSFSVPANLVEELRSLAGLEGDEVS